LVPISYGLRPVPWCCTLGENRVEPVICKQILNVFPRHHSICAKTHPLLHCILGNGSGKHCISILLPENGVKELIIIDIPYQNWQQAIRKRVSRRKFHPDPLQKKDWEHLETLMELMRKEYSGARCVMREQGFDKTVKTILGSYGLVTGASSYAVIVGSPDKSGMLSNIHAGVLGEALILEATCLDIDTCWVGGFLDHEQILVETGIEKNEKVLAVIPLGKALDAMTLTERIAMVAVQSRRRKPLSELCLGFFPENEEDWRRTAIELARLAPSAKNRQPWRFKREKNGITLISAMKEKSRGVSPYLDCGAALLHLVVGACVEKTNVGIEYRNPPEVASVYSQE